LVLPLVLLLVLLGLPYPDLLLWQQQQVEPSLAPQEEFWTHFCLLCLLYCCCSLPE
jgi:hypothetical protein